MKAVLHDETRARDCARVPRFHVIMAGRLRSAASENEARIEGEQRNVMEYSEPRSSNIVLHSQSPYLPLGIRIVSRAPLFRGTIEP